MELISPFGDERKRLQIHLAADHVMVAQSRNPTTPRNWSEVVSEVIRDPIGTRPIRQQDLAGRRVAIIADDWARPTPAWQVMPLILQELQETGVDDSDIAFITASGMHDPMDRDALARKLGAEVVARYRCVAHDAGDRKNLAFCGISRQGTPIWVNRYVAEADYKIALGRIYPHETYGYEGGYKMILPGVAGFDTIARHHALNFSSDCIPGVRENPSRREADAVGREVGIDFLINVVVNAAGQPMRAFCGEPMEVHRRGIEWGDREVWGAEVCEEADIAVASPGSGEAPRSGYDLDVLYRASRITEERGCIICVTEEKAAFDEREGDAQADESLYALGLDDFKSILPSLALSELLRLHDKRDWPIGEREIQWRLKAVRGEFYRRRRIRESKKRFVILTPDPNAALQQALAQISSPQTKVALLPEARTTFAKVTSVGSRETAPLSPDVRPRG
jgi:nickel-dependent lactate racemase